MTPLTMELMADVARMEIEDRVRRAELRRKVAGLGTRDSVVRRWVADGLRALAWRLAPSPATSEPSPLAASRTSASRVVNCS